MTTETKSYLETKLDFNEFVKMDFDNYKRTLNVLLIVDEKTNSDDYDNWFCFGEFRLEAIQELIDKHGQDKAKELIIDEVSKKFDFLIN